MNLEFKNLKFSLAEVTFEIEELDATMRVIHDRALRRAKRYLIAEAELLESIIEVARNRLFEKFACEHITPYCVKHLGLGENVAAMFVRVARKSHQVPELNQAVQAGDVCITKARTIASVITAKNQAGWISKAKSLSKKKLEAEVAAASPVGSKPERARPIGAETFRVEFELTQEQMELLRRAQDLVSQSSGKSASLAETQVALVECFLFHKDPVRKAERKKSDQSRDRSGLTAGVKHAVNKRDQGRCQARHPDGSVCGATRWVHIHHKIPKSQGGTDHPDNLITLCSSHHRLWHRRN